MEPEGMTRACPRVPLTSRKTRPIQNQARISLLTLALMEVPDSLAGAAFLAFALIPSVFTIHLTSGMRFFAISELVWTGRAGLQVSVFTFYRYRLDCLSV